MIIKYETAFKAKEKGFPQGKLYGLYNINNKSFFKTKAKNFDIQITASRQSELHTWLRDIHNIHVCVDTTAITKASDKGIWMFRIDNTTVKGGDYLYHSEDDSLDFDTYEEALEQGLLNALNFINNE